MAIEVRKRENENINSLLYRFNKRVKQSGILKEVKKRRFYERPVNRRKRRLAALHRVEKEKELRDQKRLGYGPRSRRDR